MRPSLLLLTLLAALPAGATDLIEQGERIYRQGLLIDGSLLTAVGAGKHLVSGTQAACAQCHRRSGLGSREGELPVSPITGPILFSTPKSSRPVRPGRKPIAVQAMRQETRTAYDDASLIRALHDGLDASGRALSPLMPRYQLDESNQRALLAYLHQFGSTPDPGVGDKSLRLATILTPDADPLRRQVVKESLQAWSIRGGLSNLSLPLDVWELQGEASTWTAQLDAYYRRQPVFAVLSGAAGGEWQPVARFCEAHELPCVFPIVDSAPDTAEAHFNLYFDAGLPQEARLLATWLRESGQRPSRLIQWVTDSAGTAAARQLADEFAEVPVEIRTWPDRAPLGESQPTDLWVAWLRPAQLAELMAVLPAGPTPLFASARLADPARLADLPTDQAMRLRWLSARLDPPRLQANNAVGLLPWTQHLGLPLTDASLQAEVYAASYFFADALARMRGRWSREYLLETLETGMYTRPAGRLFFSLSLGPGQRVAAKAGHVLGRLPPDYRQVGPLSPRLTP